ncbi:MAG: tyrosine-type recombinase/integrase [Proteobacteria bacterium]|nr:tyrosine-type recombinase/integrase [Pseudomonadota bacterium]
MKKGAILCNKCKKHMKGPVCSTSKCENTNCYIAIYWEGKHYCFRRDSRNEVYDYREAFKSLAKINAAMEDKKHKFDPTQWTDSSIKARRFDNQIEEYYQEKDDEVKSDELSPEYYRIIKNYHKNYFKYFNDWDVRGVDREALHKFKRECLDGLKIKSRKNILNALRAFFSWLYENGVILQMPVFPKIKGDDASPRRALRKEEQDEALKRIPDVFRDPIEFSMKTGMRPGELCAVLVKSVDIEVRVVWVERTLSGSTYRETTKNKSKLPIPLNDKALEIVERNIKGKLKNAFVFINPVTGRGYTRKYLGETWNKYSGTDVTYYEATRHSYCTHIVPLTGSLNAQRLMRHKDSRSTNNYYHAFNETLLDVVQRMDDNVIELKEVKRKRKGNEF